MRTTTFLACALLLAGPASAGMIYEATTTTDSDQPGADQDLKVKGWVDGPRAKVAFEEAKSPTFEAGSYLVTEDGGKTLYLVNPEEETYMVWDLGAMMGAAGQMMKGMGGMFQMSFRDHEVEKLLTEAGPAMLGHDTTHTRYRTHYVLEMKIMGMKQQMDTTTVQDVWWTDDLTDEGFGVWLRSAPPRTGIDELDEMIAKEIEKVEGFPLKTVAVSTVVDKKGKTSTTTTTTEVTSLQEGDVPASTFAIPAGYERIEMPDLGAAFGQQ